MATWDGIQDNSPNPWRVWFSRLQNSDPWEPLRKCDCKIINESIQENKTQTDIVIEFGRSTVNLETNEIVYNFYNAPIRKLASAVWFHKLKGGKNPKLNPITSTLDETLIEQLYVQAQDGENVDEQVVLEDDKGYKVFVAKVEDKLSLRKKPNSLISLEGHVELQRGYCEYTVAGEEEEAALLPVRHVSFVVHGIGEVSYSFMSKMDKFYTATRISI